ncbi:hypothetical protein VAE122_3060286 [Vibrio aestuarianus]|nr:hypothetical protein VAE122_3060286 [Vibrio aestuarianus]
MLQPSFQQPRNADLQQQGKFWTRKYQSYKLTAKPKASIDLPFPHLEPEKPDYEPPENSNEATHEPWHVLRKRLINQ